MQGHIKLASYFNCLILREGGEAACEEDGRSEESIEESSEESIDAAGILPHCILPRQ